MNFTSSCIGVSVEHLSVESVLVRFAKDDGSASGHRGCSLSPDYQIVSSSNDRNYVVYRLRGVATEPAACRTNSGVPILILGDNSELDGAPLKAPMGNAAVMECDVERGHLDALTSIPGLPALYLIETPAELFVTSAIQLLRRVTGISLRFDPIGVTEFALFGHPNGHRSLFSGVRVVPGGSRLSVRGGKRVKVDAAWEPPPSAPCEKWEEYVDLQIGDFERALARLGTENCVISLSGGLDSRAILAGLIRNAAKVPAITVSGENISLDARIAAKVCAAYGIEHHTIILDATFRHALPDFASEASLLSGGLGSVSHAAQMHCARALGSVLPLGNLSGYLGNQVGRRGTEGLTPWNAGVTVLKAEMIDGGCLTGPIWYAPAMQPDGLLETRFLIQQESTLSSLGAYSVGNAHHVQLSPYASRALIENMWRMPKSTAYSSGGYHARNLKHLFLGEPVRESFQRQYINRVGGPLANIPVNWGWRSKGGNSLKGTMWGALTLVDGFVGSRFAESPVSDVTKAFGIAGLYEHRPLHDWVRHFMKDFVYDEVLSRNSINAGLFDTKGAERLLNDYYLNGKRCSKEVVLMLDLALAARHFGATAQ